MLRLNESAGMVCRGSDNAWQNFSVPGISLQVIFDIYGGMSDITCFMRNLSLYLE